ncbi:hypothetical protein NBRC10512_002041 [Rhodotorula toruloides]|uniref:RHTO0S06e01574g1_1 n=2 Tax=Rhodotorula toruloides TaxID=5286 RepID=A0A061AUU3_RHOTO|nr:uncharacterized protein RHTO_06067 [Rhodotorula toruloides NP11]EMS24063.1 hypothetical protein RHTO_06067 [Rhodotorula toruloides NP11]CDR41408.1 RHTO0S06e01574g1_1 [Rhodotorula toruloides]
MFPFCLDEDPPRKRQRLASSFSTSSRLFPLPSSFQRLTQPERSGISLLRTSQTPFDPWRYTAAVLEAVSSGSGPLFDEEWSEYSSVPYFREGLTKRTVSRACTLAGTLTQRLEACYLVSPEHGEKEMADLIAGGAIPPSTRYEAPANRFPLNHDFRNELDSHSIHLVPSLDDVLARLAGEVMYFTKRQSANSATRAAEYSTIRPPWELFYKRLEARPPAVTFAFTKHSTDLLVIRQERPNTAAVNYLTARTAAEVAANESSNGLKLPVLPPVEVLCSLNLVVAAMQQRVAQPLPAPDALVVESKQIADFACILYNMWYTRSGDESKMETLVHEAQRLVSLYAPENAYASFILRPDEHELADLEPAPLPPNALRNGPQTLADGQGFLSTLQLDEELPDASETVSASELLQTSQERNSPALEEDEDDEEESEERVQRWLERVGN